MISYLSVSKHETKLRGEWMNVYIAMKIEKYKNYIYVKKFFKKLQKYLETFSLIVDSNVLKS